MKRDLNELSNSGATWLFGNKKRTEIWFTQFDARHRVMSRETTRSGLILP